MIQDPFRLQTGAIFGPGGAVAASIANPRDLPGAGPMADVGPAGTNFSFCGYGIAEARGSNGEPLRTASRKSLGLVATRRRRPAKKLNLSGVSEGFRSWFVKNAVRFTHELCRVFYRTS